MFWKNNKKKATAGVTTEFGTFVWDEQYGTWSCEIQNREGTLLLWYEGNPLQTAHLSRFRQILSDMERLSRLALESNKGDIESHDHAESEMELIGASIDPSKGAEEFSLSFSFRNWPDGGLTVHFKGSEIGASHIDD